MVTGRGAQEEIDVVGRFPLNNRLSGNVVDLCPVGALGDKDFLYRQRVWFMRRHPGVCTHCSTGCSIWVEENQDRIYRLKPRENPFVNKWWMCNDGRYGYPHVHNPRRLSVPLRCVPNTAAESGDQGSSDESWLGPLETDSAKAAPMKRVPATWTDALKALNKDLRQVGRLAAVVSPFQTVEEAYLLCNLIRGIDPKALLVLGPVPTVGEDERFPSGFTIRAEKCPNRRGVERVISYVAHRATPFEELLPELDQKAVRGVWVAGGYTDDWIDQATTSRFERLKLLVVQDLFPSPLSQRATYVLPSAAFAEREGSYVNRIDRLQWVSKAIRPPMGVRTEGSVYWDMLGRKGLYNPQEVLQDMAREIPYFSAAVGEIPESGVNLLGNLLAG